jgi:hypothetical protein
MFGRTKDINLSASVIMTIETVRRGLEIRFGTQICFADAMRITPDDRGQKDGVRWVKFETRFNKVVTENQEETKRLLSIVELRKYDGVWCFDRADLYVEDPSNPSMLEGFSIKYHLRHAMEHPFDTRLFIGSSDEELGYYGHNLTDRTEKPI